MITTAQEALEACRELLQKHNVVIEWGTKPISFEELIIARDGPTELEEIYRIIDR